MPGASSILVLLPDQQIAAAVVRPWTPFASPRYMMTPPPMKPMPATIPCMTRLTEALAVLARDE